MTHYAVGTKKKFQYEHRQRNVSYDKEEFRRDLIIEVIDQNPNIPHTHVISLCRQIAKIPKIVVERMLSVLKEENIIRDQKDHSRRNGLRTWSINSQSKNDFENISQWLDKLLLNKERILNKSKIMSTENVYWDAKKITYLVRILSFLDMILKISRDMKDRHIETKSKQIEKLLNSFLINLKNTKNEKLYFYLIHLFKNDMKELTSNFKEFRDIEKRSTVKKGTPYVKAKRIKTD